ncbi:hypothetical protein DI43_19395 [Geobacillus sp. CAMR12739]|nr:hypothetical protein DI43_19395 [Geobacillus sp. CAMR12739]
MRMAGQERSGVAPLLLHSWRWIGENVLYSRMSLFIISQKTPTSTRERKWAGMVFKGEENWTDNRTILIKKRRW